MIWSWSRSLCCSRFYRANRNLVLVLQIYFFYCLRSFDLFKLIGSFTFDVAVHWQLGLFSVWRSCGGLPRMLLCLLRTSHEIVAVSNGTGVCESGCCLVFKRNFYALGLPSIFSIELQHVLLPRRPQRRRSWGWSLFSFACLQIALTQRKALSYMFRC